MEYTVKTEVGRTIVSVLTDKPLTHCVIDVPGVSGSALQRIREGAAVWLKEGGVFVIGGGDPDRDNVAVMFPGAFAIHEEWNGRVARVEGRTAEETIALWREHGKKAQGCAIIPDPDGRIKDAFTFTQEEMNALGDPFAPKPGGVMYANDPEGISHANHCECRRCESAHEYEDCPS